MKNEQLLNAKTWSLVPFALALLTLMLFSAIVSAKVDFHADQQNDKVKFEVINVGNSPTYVLNSLTISDEKGNAVYTSQDHYTAEVLKMGPGISYVFEWNIDDVPEGNYTPKIYHGDDRKNLTAFSIDFLRGKRHNKPILYTDKAFYKYGERVAITFMNMGANTIYVNVNNWKIKNLDTGKVVYEICTYGYGFECPDSFEPLRFMNTIENDWDQTDAKRNRVVPGKYDVTAEYSKKDPSSGKIKIDTITTQKFYIRPPPPVRGDLNGNGISADTGDLDMMRKASIGEITSDPRFDLNNNGIPADAGDLVMMKRASKGEIDLQKATPGTG